MKTLSAFWAELYLSLLLLLYLIPRQGWDMLTPGVLVLLLLLWLQIRVRSRSLGILLITLLGLAWAGFSLAWLSQLAKDFQQSHQFNGALLLGGLFFSFSIAASLYRMGRKYRPAKEL